MSGSEYSSIKTNVCLRKTIVNRLNYKIINQKNWINKDVKTCQKTTQKMNGSKITQLKQRCV